ncbi:MAG: hypothetical protein RMZ69_02345 [Nostoc sp. ChiQUE01a]|nr:hypothetical protein [Nostoc sp. ChiQUE01a]
MILGQGTPENPGLLLELDRGGSCRGVIYRIAADLATGDDSWCLSCSLGKGV